MHLKIIQTFSSTSSLEMNQYSVIKQSVDYCIASRFISLGAHCLMHENAVAVSYDTLNYAKY